MVPLESETNIEVLRQYALLANKEIERLGSLLAKATDQKLETEWLHQDLKNSLSKLQKKFYGFGREGLGDARKDRPVGRQGEQLKLHGERNHAETKPEEPKNVKPQRNDVVEWTMKEPDLEMESKLRAVREGAVAWEKKKDFYQESVEITVTERVYTKVVHRQAKYKLKDEFNDTGKEVIVTAPGPAKLRAGCQYSIDFALAVVSDKYEYHIPLERQRRKMEAAGLDIDVKTLYNLAEYVYEHMLGIVPRIRLDIMNDFCAAHLDETPWLIISEKKRGQMWVLSNRIGSYFQFEPSRAGEVAEEMLKGYQGAVITDALAAYNRLKDMPGIRKGLCWSHLRREFYECMDNFPAAEEMVRMVDELFDVEAKAQTFDQLRELRRTESRAIIIRMQTWLLDESRRYLSGDGIMKAIAYASNHWAHLITFLRDLTLPLSNNDAERALRHAVMGRKNFNGSQTINGADVAAVLYTVIETAKKAGLQPKEYMKYVIEERWHGRVPKTPTEVSLEKFGKNKRVQFPAKDQWAVEPNPA